MRLGVWRRRCSVVGRSSPPPHRDHLLRISQHANMLPKLFFKPKSAYSRQWWFKTPILKLVLESGKVPSGAIKGFL